MQTALASSAGSFQTWIFCCDPSGLCQVLNSVPVKPSNLRCSSGRHAEHAIERAVLQHENDDMLDVHCLPPLVPYAYLSHAQQKLGVAVL